MADTPKPKELTSEKLRWKCPGKYLGFKTTNDLKPCTDIIGQDRALTAIKMGLELEHRGYNIFVTGLVGTGRTSTIKHLLEKLERKAPIPHDVCYMYNFRHPSNPVAIELEAGQGNHLAADMDNLIRDLKKNIPSLFRSEYYQNRRKRLIESMQAKQKKVASAFEEKISKKNFAMVSLQVGPVMKPQLVPVVDGNPVDYATLTQMVDEGKVSKEDFERMKESAESLSVEMTQIYDRMKDLERSLKKKLEKLDIDVVQPTIHEMIIDIDRKYGNDALSRTLKRIEKEIMRRLDLFRAKDEEEQKAVMAAFAAEDGHMDDPFREFRVNVVVDNSETTAPPVIIENFPNLRNVFGVIERDFTPSGWSSPDHMSIRAGAFHRANGGYLVMNALDVFIEPGVWQILKRTLKSCEAVIQNYDSWSYMSSSALKPEPMCVKVKIVLIGDSRLYYLLQSYDEDFRKIFKIRADFDREIDNRAAVIRQYAGFIKGLSDRENLKAFDPEGVAAVVEYGVRVAGRQTKLSTRFSLISDIVREAHYHADKAGRRVATREHVDLAIQHRIKRVNMLEDKIQERIDDGTIMIDTAGSVVGQVNALSVYSLGDYMFGKPSRITAVTSLGNSGVINIEREADLSGSTHNKGVLILSGFLRSRYGQESPLVMSASLCFEQSYGGVDGDSASSTELYAILSSLAELPIRQDIAVTGSINQKGEIQPIGGVNEKIEGFYAVCKARGLTGSEGVIIPWQNVPDLMLDQEVVDAVEKKKFHIYPVRHIDEGIAILTGVRAGRKLKSGKYQKGSVNELVRQALHDMAVSWKQFGSKSDKNSKGREES
jgi:ATP-dependent Lon protease